MSAPRILTIDIETFPHLLYGWGLHDQHFALNQVKEAGRMACFAAKWRGQRQTIFHSVHAGTERQMIRAAHDLFSQADMVVGWNSDSFDIKWINGVFIKHGLSPPAPYKKVDLLKSARFHARIASNKLACWAEYLGLGKKLDTGGFDLWRECMDGDEKAWRKMERYNRQDTLLTEKVYEKLAGMGWVKNQPNMQVITGAVCCTNPDCGSHRLQARGFTASITRRYQRWQCQDCGTWMQSTKCEPDSAKLKAIA